MHFIGKGLLYLLAIVLTALAVTGLQALARRYGGRHGERVLQYCFFAATAVLLSRGLPLLWPALAPWRTLVLGVSVAFVWTAMPPGLPARRHARHRD